MTVGAQVSAGQDGSVAQLAAQLENAISSIVLGKAHAIRLAVITLLSGGHLLIEDVPGVGKTSLAKALATAIDGSINRIQFTSDLLPSDITGVSIFNRSTTEFEFRPGPVFANIVIADEINRASPKAQSALLESMEEQQVTVDGNTYQLANPFFVVATQNPADMDGTHPLPEAQRDRFTTRISLGYPDPAAELAMIGEHAQVNPLASLRPVTSVTQISQLIAAVGQVHVAPEVQKYAVDLVSATRSVPEVRLGASPRATLHLIRAAKAQAALSGRGFVTPDDIQQLVVPVLAHRIVFASTYGTGHHQQQATALLSTLLSRVPVPTNGTR